MINITSHITDILLTGLLLERGANIILARSTIKDLLSKAKKIEFQIDKLYKWHSPSSTNGNTGTRFDWKLSPEEISALHSLYHDLAAIEERLESINEKLETISEKDNKNRFRKV